MGSLTNIYLSIAEFPLWNVCQFHRSNNLNYFQHYLSWKNSQSANNVLLSVIYLRKVMHLLQCLGWRSEENLRGSFSVPSVGPRDPIQVIRSLVVGYLCVCLFCGWMWYCMPLVLALERQKEGNIWVQASQGCIVRLYLKKEKQTKRFVVLIMCISMGLYMSVVQECLWKPEASDPLEL